MTDSDLTTRARAPKMTRHAKIAIANLRESYGKGPGSIWSMMVPAIRHELMLAAVLTVIRGRDADITIAQIESLVDTVRDQLGTEVGQ